MVEPEAQHCMAAFDLHGANADGADSQERLAGARTTIQQEVHGFGAEKAVGFYLLGV